jgi:hypothetical protein
MSRGRARPDVDSAHRLAVSTQLTNHDGAGCASRNIGAARRVTSDGPAGSAWSDRQVVLEVSRPILPRRNSDNGGQTAG